MLLLALLHHIANLSWWRWSVHPSTAIGIAALGVLYVWAETRLARKGTTAQRSFFFAGLVVLFATLNGPIHDLSDDYLFSAHMRTAVNFVPSLLMPTVFSVPAVVPFTVRAVAPDASPPTVISLLLETVLVSR